MIRLLLFFYSQKAVYSFAVWCILRAEVKTMQSLWTATAVLPEYEALNGDRRAEAAVIGAGMAGILTARLLKEAGVDVVVLEADRIGSGQTKNTTAKITSQHGMIYHKLAEVFSAEAAAHYASAQEKAIGEYRRIIAEYEIDCEFAECSAYLYSRKEAGPLLKEAETAKAAGIDAAFTEETELPFPIKGAVRFGGQARFHPLKFLGGTAEGLTIYEHTPVLTVEGNRIKTGRGTVTAEHIIFACHYPFINVPGYYFMRMHQERSYVKALEGASLPEGMYYGIDEGGLSIRRAGNLLLLGGGSHRTGENREGGRYRWLLEQAREYWPQCRERFRWSAQDCMPLDNIPYIGQFSGDTPNWYVATGFKKWGMTGSMAAAMMLRDAVTGRENPDAELFSPQRFTPSASAVSFVSEGAHAVKNLTRRIFAPPRAETEELPCGHGGVVEYEGEKAGVYKEEDGTLHVVSVKCPHMGCQLEWNSDEKTWDCPCHGSRFDYRGKLLNNPAQEDLETAEQ